MRRLVFNKTGGSEWVEVELPLEPPAAMVELEGLFAEIYKEVADEHLREILREASDVAGTEYVERARRRVMTEFRRRYPDATEEELRVFVDIGV